MTSYNFQEIYNSMKNDMIANQDSLTDFNDGSIIATLYESIARVIERIYIETRIGYTNNLKEIAYALFNFERKTGTKATTKVVFSRGVKISSQTIIASGTKVSDGSNVFITTEQAVIPANSLESNSVIVEAEDVGFKYNVDAAKIKNIESIVPSDVVSVTNSNAARGGTDNETDNEMQSRFQLFLNGLQGTTDYGLKAALLAINGIRSVEIIQHKPPVAGYNLTIYLDNATGSISDELMTEIKKVVNGDPDNSATYPGYRAAGVNVNFASANAVAISIRAKITLYRTEHTQADYDIKELLTSAINDLTIGEDIVVSNLIMKLRQLSYVKDITFISINGGTAFANYNIAKNQIARFEAVELEYEDI